MTDLVKKMVNYRAKHSMSMREFAQKCGLSLQTVCSIENETQTPSRLTEGKIRLVLDADKEEG